MPREKKSFRQEDIDGVWKAISALAAEIRHLADQLKEEGFDGELVVDAGDAMRSGLDHIATWLSKCEQDYRTRRTALAIGPKSGQKEGSQKHLDQADSRGRFLRSDRRPNARAVPVIGLGVRLSLMLQ